jgi:transcriptional regulator with XRE-family HTH domain
MKLEIGNRQRSKKVIITNQARALKRLREERGLSLREVAKRLGKNHTTIAHIEGGRMDVPKGDRLMELLAVYGVDNYRAFYDKVRNYSEKIDPKDELRELIDRLSPDRVGIALEILKQVAEGRRIVAV